MSLVNTLAKVAIGVAIAKGAKSVLGGSGQSSAGGGLGGLLGGALGGAGGSAGGLGDLLGDALQGGTQRGGGLGDLLGGALGNGGSKGGLDLGGLMGGLAGGAGSAGGLGDILGQLGGTGAAGGLGGLLTDALANGGQVTRQPAQEEEDAAGAMIRAMLQAAKADGQIDAAERENLLKVLGDLDDQERSVIQAAMDDPIDVNGLARDIPSGSEDQAYMMSLMAIDLDTQGEASYLHDLGQALGLSQSRINEIHQVAGVPALYR